ncbi:MAG: ABC transporter substrate-binding protein [Acidobacteriota bacterium]
MPHRRPSAGPRIVSLVPNATEILFAIGAGDLVVGVSHECDYPPAARLLPQLTRSALSSGLTASEVDAAVSAQLESGKSLYQLDERQLAALRPDLLFTQELCAVCAVSTAQVEAAITPLAHCPQLVSLDPRTLPDVLADVLSVGEVVGRRMEARRLRDSLDRRLDALRAALAGRARPRVAALEWLDPPFLGGHWVPEMIAAAGGDDIFAKPGESSTRVQWSVIEAADPDVVVAMPCGFDEAGAIAQIAGIPTTAPWHRLRAVRTGKAFAVDANGCFSRPGPRLVDGIERLAGLFHPSADLEARRP